MAILFFCIVNIFIAACLIRKNTAKKNYLRLKIQDLKEKANILAYQNRRELDNQTKLRERIKRYHNLKNIIEKINQNPDVEQIAEGLVLICFSLIAGEKGACLLYLIDPQTQLNLNLFKAKKEDERLIVKAKEGDIFDIWVSRHLNPLFIEDTRKDFRFDAEKLTLQDSRPIGSLVSAPLTSGRRLLGILRLDNPQPRSYAQDDLRFLVAISDLGAVALENGMLFEKTQDLAIHDGLTAFFTKGYFLERLKEEYKRSARRKTPFSLLMLDIDFFKDYNDKFGHTAGDIVLRNLSQNITETLKNFSPIISRFGGEEFCIILPHIEKKEALDIAETLRKKIEETKIILRKQQSSITVSIGVVNFPLDSRDEDDLILKVDQAMYRAKQKGRNRVCCV